MVFSIVPDGLFLQWPQTLNTPIVASLPENRLEADATRIGVGIHAYDCIANRQQNAMLGDLQSGGSMRIPSCGLLRARPIAQARFCGLGRGVPWAGSSLWTSLPVPNLGLYSIPVQI